MDLDDLLPQVGEFGRYQKLLVWLVCLPACVPCGFCAFNQLFMADTPDHWCLVPELMEYDVQLRKQLAIPITEDSDNVTSYSKCQRYNVNWTQLLSDFDIDSLSANVSWPVVSCDQGWEFDTSVISSSIVIDYELVCQYDIYPTYGLVALNAGGPIGVYMFGIINDRFGRRLSFFICLATLIFGNLTSAFMPDFWLWAFCRAVVGLTIPAVYQIPFIISLELVGPNYRSFVTVMTCLFYTLGLVLLAGVTYLVRDWVHLSIVTSLPFLLYYIYWWFLPESPRWLLAKGRLEEASKILETLAAVNQKELPDSFKLKLKQRMMLQRTRSEMKRLETGPGVSALFRTPNMRLKTILITLNWFANEMVYVGLSYYGPALGSDQYLSFLLSSLVEIPSYLACWVVMDRWGRRWPLVICMIASGICCIITVLLPPEAVTETLVLFLMSKFAISASFLIIYPFTGELYPTQLRGVGIGFSAYISGLGLIIIPFITYLGSEHLVLPLVIMGAVSVVGGITSLRLPETLHHRLPQTVEEGEEFGKDWTLTDCLRCIPLQPNSINTSYEDLDAPVEVELQSQTYRPAMSLSLSTPDKESALLGRRPPRLVRQASIMETPLDSRGSMKMTYWF
ncbi:carcinine transporter-like [Macrosteles quadrilineatus]|uniref:carcinine transporter-like n=1 Tax=Macrosteles quadrilineatus TaxID=74068 RepID=UPI0023E28353|nr:carcinine transporter-like [Macrosteles quadrilineatus]